VVRGRCKLHMQSSINVTTIDKSHMLQVTGINLL